MNPRNLAATVKPLILNLYAFAVSFFFFLTNFSTKYIFRRNDINTEGISRNPFKKGTFVSAIFDSLDLYSFVCLFTYHYLKACRKTIMM